MRFRALHISSRARGAFLALSLWGGCALAVEGPPPAPAVPSGSISATTAPALVLDKPTPTDFKSFGPDDSAGEGFGWTASKAMVGLGLVLGLIYLTLNFGLRRMMGIQGFGASGREPFVKVIERVALDPKRSMFVVKAAGEYLLLGAGDGPLNLISKLDPVEVARIESLRATPSTPLISPFLQKLLSRRGGSAPPSA